MQRRGKVCSLLVRRSHCFGSGLSGFGAWCQLSLCAFGIFMFWASGPAPCTDGSIRGTRQVLGPPQAWTLRGWKPTPGGRCKSQQPPIHPPCDRHWPVDTLDFLYSPNSCPIYCPSLRTRLLTQSFLTAKHSLLNSRLVNDLESCRSESTLTPFLCSLPHAHP